MSLFEFLEIDPDDVVEQQCGMKHCTGPAMRDTAEWLKVGLTATKEGETVGESEASIPMCPQHGVIWNVFFDCVPEANDLLVLLISDLVDLDRHPVGKQLAENIERKIEPSDHSLL